MDNCLFLVFGLPYLVFEYIMKLKIVGWIWLLLVITGYILGHLVAIRIAYILYIHEFQ